MPGVAVIHPYTVESMFNFATVTSLACGSAPVVPLNDSATGSPGLKFDAASGTFTYNWAPGTVSCRKVTIKLRDNTLHQVLIKIL